MNSLKQLLRKQQHDFDSDFSTKVMNASIALQERSLSVNWFLLGAAASVGLCILSTYLLEGQLDIDTLLGTDGLYNDTLNEYLNTH
jgi:hypothetical protein